MSGMNEFLSQYYNTGAASAPAETDMNEDLHKQASIELFCKLAASNNVDLESCSEEQIQQLFADFQKQASEDGPPKDDKKGDKKEEAKKELEEKKAAAEKTAEADYLGRVMAHSYIDELNKIAASKGMVHIPGQGSSASHSGGNHPGASAKSVKPESAGFMKVRHALEKGKDKAKDLAGKAGVAAGKAGNFLGKHKHFAGAVAAGAAGVGAGAALASGKKKEASAVDELAAGLAVEKAAAGGYDADEAAEKIAAVLTLGIESEKTAGVFDVDQAVDIRSLELLEMAGYPVTWPE